VREQEEKRTAQKARRRVHHHWKGANDPEHQQAAAADRGEGLVELKHHHACIVAGLAATGGRAAAVGTRAALGRCENATGWVGSEEV